MQGFPTVRCNGKCTKCPIKFHCYTTEGSEYLEVTPEERFTTTQKVYGNWGKMKDKVEISLGK